MGDVPVQLRRRREASYRLPPLDDGRRDPWHDDTGEWTVARLVALVRTVDHLRALGLHSPESVTDDARRAWRRHRGEVRAEIEGVAW